MLSRLSSMTRVWRDCITCQASVCSAGTVRVNLPGDGSSNRVSKNAIVWLVASWKAKP